jgi:D-threonine aldolase
VISRPSPARVTIDAGQKAITAGSGLPEPVSAELRTVALHEEHGLLDLDNSGVDVRVGDKLMLTPGHAGTTIKLYDCIYAIREGRVAEIWEIGASRVG